MTQTVGTYEMRTHFSELLDRAARGEVIRVSRHGVPVAQLGPIDDTAPSEAHQAIAGIKRLRQGLTLDGISLTDLRDEGRR